MTRAGYLKLLVSVLALAALVLMHTRWLDHYGEEYTEQGLKRVLVTYAVARGLNGLISVAQGTEVSVEPAGIGMTFTPGQILAPVNDLIERFSWILLASGVSLGIQRVLLQMVSWQGFAWLISAVVMIAIAASWWRNCSPALSKALARIALLLLLLRFAIPVIALVNQGIYQAFLQSGYETSSQVLDQASADMQQDVAAQTVSPAPPNDGVMDKLKRMMQSASEAVDVSAQFDKLKQKAADLSEHIFNIIVVFMLQTIIFPVLLLWLMYHLAQRLLRVG
jgi:hypothetical protein